MRCVPSLRGLGRSLGQQLRARAQPTLEAVIRVDEGLLGYIYTPYIYISIYIYILLHTFRLRFRVS